MKTLLYLSLALVIALPGCISVKRHVDEEPATHTTVVTP